MKRKLNYKVIVSLIIAVILLSNFGFVYHVSAVDVYVKAGELQKINESGNTSGCNALGAKLLMARVGNTSVSVEQTFLTAVWDFKNKACNVFQLIKVPQPSQEEKDAGFNLVTAGGRGKIIERYQARGMMVMGVIDTPSNTTWGHTYTPVYVAELASRPSAKIYYLFRTEYALAAEARILQLPEGTEINSDNFGDQIGYQEAPNAISRTIGFVINKIVGVLTYLITKLATLAGKLLSWSIDENTKGYYPDIVTQGWTIVRDIMNMFFILAMIIMALMSILQLGEEYNYRHLLPKIILMALLINFSKVIATSFIDFSNVIVLMFARGWQLGNFFGPYARALADFGSAGVSGWQAALISSGSAFVLSLVMLIAFLAVAILLLIRTIGLWFLVILSPVAFALNILPATQEYAKKWWSTFFKYLIWAPVAVFFLRLGDILIVQLRTRDPSKASSFDFIIIMAFMFGSVIVAEQAGMVGAGAVIDMAKHGAQMAAKLPLGAAMGLGKLGLRSWSKYTGLKIGEKSKEGEVAANLARQAQLKLKKGGLTPDQEKEAKKQLSEAKKEQRKAAAWSAGWRVASLIDPKVLKEAWAKRQHEQELRAYGPAVGHMQDTFNRMMPTEWLRKSRLAKGEFGKKTYHGLVGERAVVATEAKELLEGVRTREDAARVLRDAFKSGDKDEIMAGLKVLQHGNWQDDYMNLEGETFSISNYLDHITEKMKAAGFSKEEMTTILDDLKETGETNKRIRAYGLTTQDPDGKVRAANDHEYYRNLSQDNLSTEFTKIAEKFKLAYDETQSEEFGQLAAAYDTAAADAKGGVKFDDIIDRRYGTGRKDMTLKSALTQRRFMNEANSKLQRGEGHARALEAAIFVDQTTDGYEVQNLLGKMLMHEMPPNVIASVTNRIHESQGRLLYGFGGFRDKQTGKWSLPDIELIARKAADVAAEPDPEKKKIIAERADFHEMSFKKIMETQRLAPNMFESITTSDRLYNVTQRDEFKRQYNAYLAAHAGSPAVANLHPI